jgi:hypothetical protein
MATISVLGVDLGKNLCRVVGLDGASNVLMRRRVRRETLIGMAEKRPTCVVGMEACCGAHHLGRVFASASGRPQPDSLPDGDHQLDECLRLDATAN